MAVGMAGSTLLVSAHASQGPHLGLPQMVQSRPQFGRYGALLIWTVAILLYWGFIVSCFNFLEVTAIQIVHVTSYWWVLPTVVLSAILAIYGYDLLHASQRYISYILVVILTTFFVGTLARNGFPVESLNLIGTFDTVKFMVVVSTSFAYALTWAVFVSDYSRYLPEDTSHRALISWTSAGVWGGCFFMAAVGSIAAVLFPASDMIPAVQQASDRVFPGFGAILIGFGTIALITYIGMCTYGGALTLISAVDSFRPTVPSRSVRALVMVGFTASAAYVGHVLPQEFLSTGFVIALTVAGLFLAPWTAHQPRGRLRHSQGEILDHRDLQSERHLQTVELARPAVLRSWICRDDSVRRHRQLPGSVHPISRRRRHLPVRRHTAGRAHLLPAVPEAGSDSGTGHHRRRGLTAGRCSHGRSGGQSQQRRHAR